MLPSNPNSIGQQCRAGATHQFPRRRLVDGAVPTCARILIMRALLVTAMCAGSIFSTPGRTDGAPAPPTPTAMATLPQLPEPIYWKQQLFLIPYQWGSAAEPGVAQAVWLFVSKDRGVSWQKISEARPQVKAFNYRAEGDGEYWFAVRTRDKQGRVWPQGPYQPELRVIVDTTLPRIDDLRVRLAENGAIEIQARATDLNLDPAAWRFEWQADPAAPWQPVTLQGATQPSLLPAPSSQFHAFWQPPAGTRPGAIRGIIFDRAGNSATYQTRLDAGPAVSGPMLTSPAVGPTAIPQQPVQTQPLSSAAPNSVATQSNPASQSWESASASTVQTAQMPATQPPATPTSQPWPANNVARAPIRLWTSGAVQQDDGVTSYGSPSLFSAPPSPGVRTDTVQDAPRTEARYAGLTKPSGDTTNVAVPTVPASPQFTALEPYRESSTNQPATPKNDVPPPVEKPTARNVTPVDVPSAQHSPTAPPKLVGSRTFALEYDLENAGRGGVTKVELWGTRDGGQTWSRYVQDDDNRSPLIVTVDDEGLYGFRILVQTADGPSTEPPRAGDAPELWVSVDLKRPVVALTAIERGQGNFADHLLVRWHAADNNLESRPIALFYSSRPTGPWSAIATNLENTGEYSWRVERYVPTRFYLRIEAHDTAGNLAAFQTRDPIEFSPASVAGRLRSAQPLGRAAAAADGSFR